jgi:peptidoglycan/xylan/chitin deacetylase (PgdA/CDA1 family)
VCLRNSLAVKVRLKKTIQALDTRLADICLPITDEQGSLLSLLIHGLFESGDEAESGTLDPQQGFTVGMLRIAVEHFTREGYRFVSPEDMAAGLSRRGKYVLLTFDDGYYNNTRALPVLEEFDVPAVFFVSSDHVKLGKAFWWDVVYREFKKQGRTNAEIGVANARYKHLRTPDVESDVRKQFGESAFLPAGDLDRPFTVAELTDFANHPLVFLGNHTKDHAILTNYSSVEIKEQILGGQQAIRDITGKTPRIIAYPNGNHSAEIRSAARQAGLAFGVLARPGRNRLPLASGALEAMTVKRFTLWGERSIEQQCRVFRSAVSLGRLFSSIQHGRRTGSIEVAPLSARAAREAGNSGEHEEAEAE